MRFWQKAALLLLAVFLLAMDGVLYASVHRGYRLSESVLVQAALEEQRLVHHSLEARLSTALPYYSSFNENNLRQYAAPYGEYYRAQRTYLALVADGAVLYSSLPEGAAPARGETGSPAFRALDGRLYLMITTPLLTANDQGIQMVYCKDASALEIYKQDMLRFFLYVSLAAAAVLGIAVVLLLLRLTAPLRALNAAAAEIALGDFGKRVSIQSRDEIGEFAGTFNRMADSVETKVAALEDMSSERQRFIDNLSHELRTPITAVLGYGEVLRYANASDGDKALAVDYIIEQGRRIRGLSEKLLHLTRLQHGAALDMRAVALLDVVEAARRTLGGQLSARGVSLRVEGGGATVTGDPALLEMLLVNLLENALRASEAGQTIRVRVARRESAAVLSVLDEGIGIPAEALAHIQEPFYRVDAARSRASGGAGLGLSLCRQICALHGAALSFLSSPGKGTEARVEFTTP